MLYFLLYYTKLLVVSLSTTFGFPPVYLYIVPRTNLSILSFSSSDASSYVSYINSNRSISFLSIAFSSGRKSPDAKSDSSFFFILTILLNAEPPGFANIFMISTFAAVRSIINLVNGILINVSFVILTVFISILLIAVANSLEYPYAAAKLSAYSVFLSIGIFTIPASGDSSTTNGTVRVVIGPKIRVPAFPIVLKQSVNNLYVTFNGGIF